MAALSGVGTVSLLNPLSIVNGQLLNALVFTISGSYNYSPD